MLSLVPPSLQQLLPPLLLLLVREVSDVSAAATGIMAEHSLDPGAIAIGPNGVSMQQQPDAWLILKPDDTRADSLETLKTAAAVHLQIAPDVLLLADASGQHLRSIEQAVRSRFVYGRHLCEESAATCEHWMWPAHKPGERVAVTMDANDGGNCHTGDMSTNSVCTSVTTASGDGAEAYQLETLSTSPRVFRVASFLSQSELVQINSMVRVGLILAASFRK